MDDFFGNNNGNDDFFGSDFGNSSGGSDDFFTDNSNQSSGDDFFNMNDQNMQTNQQNTQVQEQPKMKFGNKMTALIIIGALLVLALILAIFNNIHVTKKDDTQKTTQSTQQNQQQSTQQQNTQQTAGAGDLLLYNANGVALDYSTRLTTSATVKAKNQYLSKSNHQVIYEIQAEMGVGTDLIPVHFTCTHSTYVAVNVGDTLQVAYYVVSQGENGGYWALDVVDK